MSCSVTSSVFADDAAAAGGDCTCIGGTRGFQCRECDEDAIAWVTSDRTKVGGLLEASRDAGGVGGEH